MATALRPIGHEDRLALVDHLDELRKRLVICVIALAVTTGLAFWQADTVLDILNEPLQSKRSGEQGSNPLEQAAVYQGRQREAQLAVAAFLASLDAGGFDAEQRRLRAEAVRLTQRAARTVPPDTVSKPVTLGVAEPFTATISVSFYTGLLLALPLLLYQAYAFVLPAFTPRERKVALPLMLLVPVLFIGGVLFGYFVVLQRAIAFLQNFNDDDFDILVQAREYYRFSILFLAAIGLLFQIPVGVLAVTRSGWVTPRQLRKNRGYVILGIAALAAVATPTPDPITMLLAMGPLIILFELSILLALWLDRARPLDPDVPDEELEADDDEPRIQDDDLRMDDEDIGRAFRDPDEDDRDDELRPRSDPRED
ncbi:MAG: twin-arginine translocase subunit TatC [Solirubrobacterales bacterium]|nr:twin-arginine translocase subunit TatC [Solirubrobacterales bacterium]